MRCCCVRAYLQLPGVAAAAMLLCQGLTVGAQELEPRRWSHLPAEFNFVGAAYAVTQADIYVDPVFEAEDVELSATALSVQW